LNNGCELVRLATLSEGVIATEYGYQFFPHRIKGEGFYLAVLSKKKSPGSTAEVKARNLKTLPAYGQIAQHYLENPETFTVIERNEKLFALLQLLVNDFQWLASQLYIRQAGINMGHFKGKDFLPAHELALSIHLRKNLPAVELSEEEAIAYLRCDTVKVNTGQRGWVLARHKGFNLGWLKVLEGRANNYYPKEWRILKAIQDKRS
jgi:NOL1/NOP2/fmu family ribosome biogenesis protein